MKLKLVNPLLVGQFNTTYNVIKPLDAAVNFWNDLSAHTTNNMPSMKITFMDEKNELFHFEIKERLKAGSKSVNFTVKEKSYKISNEEKAIFINTVQNEEKEIKNKAAKQSGGQSGGKMKNAPNKKDYKIPPSSSSSSDSNSDSDSDSLDSSDKDGDLYDFSKYRRLSQPIIYYSYTPFLYKITNFYTPTFVLPLTPYVRTWIPNP